MNRKVVIVDYELGNLFSVNQALKNIGLNTVVSSEPNDIKNADAIVLPGVGAFGDAMKNLNDLQLTEPIKEFVLSGKPFFGICLGLQLLFTNSEEFGNCAGLDIIKGTVKKFNNLNMAENFKVPQIGWNTIQMPLDVTWSETPLKSIKNLEHMYFVHSFYVVPEQQDIILTYTEYGNLRYASSVLQNNIFACQFHPEKSATEGLKIYFNWALQNGLISLK